MPVYCPVTDRVLENSKLLQERHHICIVNEWLKKGPKRGRRVQFLYNFDDMYQYTEH